MRRSVLILSAAVALAACGEGKAPQLQSVPALAKLTERVYVVHGPNELPNKANQGFMNNPGFVVTSKGVVVVDPGSSLRVGEMLLAKIAEVTKEPVIAVFNTHIHGDHWLANQAIKAAHPKAIIYAHPKMKAKAVTDGARWVELLNRMTDGALKGTQPVAPEVEVNHEESIKLGDRRFRFYHNGHAHTDGDLMIEVVEDKLMFVGDNVIVGRVGRMDEGHFRGNVAAIELALASGAEHFVPGHGPSNGRDALRAYQAYFKTLYAEVRKYYEKDPTDPDIKSKVVPALERFRGWKDFDEQVGRHVSLVIKEIETDSF